MLFFSSCEKEKSVIFDLNILPDEISRIELRADHKMLVPNGVSQMGFHTFVYGKRTVMSYKRVLRERDRGRVFDSQGSVASGLYQGV